MAILYRSTAGKVDSPEDFERAWIRVKSGLRPENPRGMCIDLGYLLDSIDEIVDDSVVVKVRGDLNRRLETQAVTHTELASAATGVIDLLMSDILYERSVVKAMVSSARVLVEFITAGSDSGYVTGSIEITPYHRTT